MGGGYGCGDAVIQDRIEGFVLIICRPAGETRSELTPWRWDGSRTPSVAASRHSQVGHVVWTKFAQAIWILAKGRRHCHTKLRSRIVRHADAQGKEARTVLPLLAHATKGKHRDPAMVRDRMTEARQIGA